MVSYSLIKFHRGCYTPGTRNLYQATIRWVTLQQVIYLHTHPSCSEYERIPTKGWVTIHYVLFVGVWSYQYGRNTLTTQQSNRMGFKTDNIAKQ